MDIKRFPPWSTKGGAARATIKNHPQSDQSDVGLPIRRFPPWSTKGSAQEPRVVKNHRRSR